jgi:hypothetical protein
MIFRSCRSAMGASDKSQIMGTSYRPGTLPPYRRRGLWNTLTISFYFLQCSPKKIPTEKTTSGRCDRGSTRWTGASEIPRTRFSTRQRKFILLNIFLVLFTFWRILQPSFVKMQRQTTPLIGSLELLSQVILSWRLEALPDSKKVTQTLR